MLKLSKITIPHTSLRLNLLVVCETVLLLLVSLAVMLYFSRQALKDEAKSDAEETLEGTVQNIDNVLMNVEQTADIICQDLLGHLHEPDRMYTYCRKVVESNPYVVGSAIVFKPGYYPGRELFMAYVHRNGSVKGDRSLVTSSKFGRLPYTEQGWYTEPMKSGRAVWTDPLREEEDEGVTLSFCLPIKENGVSVGVLVVDLPVADLSEIVLATRPYPHSYSVLLGRHGSYIVHPDKQKLSRMMTVFGQAGKSGNPSVREAAEAMVSGETGHKPFRMDNKDWYVFYKPFQRAQTLGVPREPLGWSVGMVYLEDDILGEHNILVYLVLAITVFALIVFFVLCRVLIRRQLKPLRMLARAAQRIADGNYNETVPDAQRDDEIGQLQDHFRHMQVSLVTKTGELEQLTTRLRHRSEELRKAYGKTQGSDRMKTTFLHYMTTQMTVPSDLIERSVMRLSNSYYDISPEEAEHEVQVIKEQSGTVLSLLNKMIEALKIEEEETEKELLKGKEAANE